MSFLTAKGVVLKGHAVKVTRVSQDSVRKAHRNQSLCSRGRQLPEADAISQDNAKAHEQAGTRVQWWEQAYLHEPLAQLPARSYREDRECIPRLPFIVCKKKSSQSLSLAGTQSIAVRSHADFMNLFKSAQLGCA